MVMVICGKYITTCLRILYFTGVKSNIGHHAFKVVYNHIGPIILYVAYKEINQNLEGGVLLMLDHYVDLLDNLTEYESRQ